MTSSDLSPAGADEPALHADGLQWARLGPDEVVLKRGVAEVRLASPDISDTVERLVGLADGSRTEAGLVDAFPGARQNDVRALVAALRARRFLVPAGQERDPASAFWQTMSSRAPDGRERLAAAAVLVVGDGAVGTELVSALRTCGVGRVDVEPLDGGADLGAAWDVACAASDGADWERLLAASAAALNARRLLLPVWIEDLVIHIGPLTHPYDTACLRCYRLRRQSNDTRWAEHALLADADGAASHGAGFLPTMASVAGQVAATEVVKQLAGLPTSTTGRAIELALVPYRSALHRVLRVPRCPDCCGTASRGAPVLLHGSQMAE